jgi:hypothetical protein
MKETLDYINYRIDRVILIALSKTIFRRHKWRWHRIRGNYGT